MGETSCLCVVQIDFIICINIRLLFLFFSLLVPIAEAYSQRLLFPPDKQVFLFVPIIAWGLFPVWLDCQWHDRWDGGSVLGNAWALVSSTLESHFTTGSFSFCVCFLKQSVKKISGLNTTAAMRALTFHATFN